MKPHTYTPAVSRDADGKERVTNWCKFTDPPLDDVKPGQQISFYWQSASHKLHKVQEAGL